MNKKPLSQREARSSAAKSLKSKGAIFLEGGQGHMKVLAQQQRNAQNRMTPDEKAKLKEKLDKKRGTKVFTGPMSKEAIAALKRTNSRKTK